MFLSWSVCLVPTRIEVKVYSPPEAEVHSIAEKEASMPMSKRARLMTTADDGQIHCHRTLEEVEFAAQWFHSVLRQ
jgi:hypothetical protein